MKIALAVFLFGVAVGGALDRQFPWVVDGATSFVNTVYGFGNGLVKKVF